MLVPTLTLDTTTLDAPSSKDAAAYSEAHDEGVMKSLLMDDRPSLEKSRQDLERALEYWRDGRPDWRFAVRDARDHAFAGMVKVRETGSGGTHTLEYWIAPQHRCRGHAKRAAALATKFAFCDRRIRSLRAEIIPPNLASEAVLLSVGFWKVGHTLPLTHPRTGERIDLLYYFITRRRWLESRGEALGRV